MSLFSRIVKKTAVQWIIVICVFLGLSALLSSADAAENRSPQKAKLNPFQGRQKRADDFSFAVKPAVKKDGDKYVISFTTAAACDATVMVVDKDGKVVRHLASGVLGKNAPWPFKQGSLSQEIVWDGNDDQGKAVDTGSCTIKVGLGLTAGYGRSLGWGPGRVTNRRAIGVDSQGRLYILDGLIGTGGSETVSFNIRVFDREGRYLRRIAPPVATVDRTKTAHIRWNRTAWGTTAPAHSYAGFVCPMTKNSYMGVDALRQTPAITRDGRFIFATPWRRRHPRRYVLMVNGRDGAVAPGNLVAIDPKGKIMGKANAHHGGPLHMAVSPDDRWLYIGSPERGSRHAVFRMDMKNPGPVKAWLGSPNKAGSDNKHFKHPLGVACDAKGNVYVADSGNNRIQVFKPDGSYLKTLPLKNPQLLTVHRKTGAIYAIHFSRKDKKWILSLVKLGGLDDPSIKAKGPGVGVRSYQTIVNYYPLIALDDSGETTQVWMKLYSNSIKRLRDDGDAFKALPVGDINKKPGGWGRWSPWAHQCHITADPVREELYIRENDMSYPSGMLRVDGRTGKVIDRFGSPRARSGFGVEQAKMGPDGKLYIRAQSAGTRLVCYDPDKKKLVPLPAANKKATVKFKGQKVPAVVIGASRGARTFQDMMGVAPNGDLYIPCGIRTGDKALLKKNGLEAPTIKNMYNNPFAASLLKIYSAKGKLKCLSAMPGLGPSQGIEIGRSGSVYMALECQPTGIKTPEGLAAGAKSSPHYWGTVVKFDARLNQYPIGSIRGRWSKKIEGKPTHNWGMAHWGYNGPVRIEGMLWDYPGMSTFRQRNCMCPKSNISMDGFERLYVPALHSCSINVLDANGNMVARIGAYGNADSRGKDSPVPDPETGELRPRRKGDPEDLKSPLAEPEIGLCHPNFTAVTDEALYINDRGNERIVRAVLEYKTVKEVAVE